MDIVEYIRALGLGIWDWLAGVSYGLLALSYVMRDIRWLRTITIAASTLDLAIYFNIRPNQPMWVQFGFSAVFIAINVYQLYVLWLDTRDTRFDGDAKTLFETVFKTLSPGEFRRVLAIGQFVQMSPGDFVLRMDHDVEHVTVVAAGEFGISRLGNILSYVSPGGFIGEMGYVTRRPASVNVHALRPSRVLQLSVSELRRMEIDSPELHGKLTGLMGRDIAEKLRMTTLVIDQKEDELHGFRASQFVMP